MTDIKKFTKTFFGDKDQWKEVFKVIAKMSQEKGDERDLKYLQSLIKNEQFPDYLLEEKLAKDSTLNRLKVIAKSVNEKYGLLSKQFDNLLEAHELLLAFQDVRPLTQIPIIDDKQHQSIVFVQWSDWHVGEVVTKGSTNGLNQYNPKVCARRVDVMVNNTIRLIRKELAHSNVMALVIHLGGDFINGWIHDENKETNSMTPVEEIEFATKLLESSIYTLLNTIDIPIKIVCNVGNHGRYTKRFRFGSEKQTSFETLLYSNIVKTFKDEIEFQIPESTVFNITFMKQRVRFHHGHQVRYKDGVGGLTIPLNKRQHKWNETDYADFNFMGHYHTCSMPNKTTVMNGSLVGYNGLAMFAGFAYEPPQQSFIVYHSKYGWTAFHKILAD